MQPVCRRNDVAVIISLVCCRAIAVTSSLNSFLSTMAEEEEEEASWVAEVVLMVAAEDCEMFDRR